MMNTGRGIKVFYQKEVNLAVVIRSVSYANRLGMCFVGVKTCAF